MPQSDALEHSPVDFIAEQQQLDPTFPDYLAQILSVPTVDECVEKSIARSCKEAIAKGCVRVQLIYQLRDDGTAMYLIEGWKRGKCAGSKPHWQF